MATNQKSGKLKVFLSEASEDVLVYRSFLHNVLRKAELDVVCADESKKADFQLWQYELQKALELADCSIHIMGNQYGMLINNQKSLTEYQLTLAKSISNQQNEDFRIFIWQPRNIAASKMERQQEQFITSIKNSILHNITISYHESPVTFVEDIHSVMAAKNISQERATDTEIFFIYNELDDEYAKDIIDLVGDVLKVEKLAMVQNAQRDYSGYISEQVKKSKLVVVYFKYSSNWAMPFVQQLWRLIGGASSQTEVLLIADNSQQISKSLAMPKVTTLFVSEELIPLEIKVQYDRIVGS